MTAEWPEYALDALAGVLIYALVLPALRRPMNRVARVTVVVWLVAMMLGMASCR